MPMALDDHGIVSQSEPCNKFEVPNERITGMKIVSIPKEEQEQHEKALDCFRDYIRLCKRIDAGQTAGIRNPAVELQKLTFVLAVHAVDGDFDFLL